MRLALAILATLALSTSSSARARPLLALLGDSTAFGTIDTNFGQAEVTTAEALEAMLRVVPKGHPWRRAKVLNLGVPGASTRDWTISVHPGICQVWGSHLPYLADACARGVPLLDVVPARARGLLVVLGYADGVFDVPPEETVANLRTIRARFPSAQVYIAAPFVPAANDVYREPRDVRRQAILDAGLLSGPDWPALPLVDQVHLSTGGYAAAAGLWLDTLR